MADTDGVLAAIDACLEDWSVSDDAMRWAPDEPDPTPEGAYGPGAVGWSGAVGERFLNPDMLTWPSTILRTQGVVFGAIGDDPEAPVQGELVRFTLPDSSSTLHRLVSVTPGESFGEFVLTIEPAVTRLTEAAESMRRTAETALASFGKAFGPFLSATQAAMHRALYSNEWKHHRRCPVCNPRGFPKPLVIDGREYNRRRRGRNGR